MISRAHIIWWQLSLFESSSHSVENRIGLHTSVIDQGTVNSTINHVLKFTRICFKSKLPRSRQCFFLDYFATPVDAEGLQTLLLVVLHGFCNSLFCSSLRLDSVTGMTFSKSNLVVDMSILILNLVPLGVPKDVLMQKRICKHKGLIPDSNVKACQPI